MKREMLFFQFARDLTLAVGRGVKIISSRELQLALAMADRVQLFGGMVSLTMLGLADVEEAISKALSAERGWRGVHVEETTGSLNGGEGRLEAKQVLDLLWLQERAR